MWEKRKITTYYKNVEKEEGIEIILHNAANRLYYACYLVLMICCVMLVTDVTGQAIAINPDGTHSVVVGNVAINPDGTHSVVVGNVAINPNGTHSIVAGNVAVNPNETHATANNRTGTVENTDRTLSEFTGSSGARIAVSLYGNQFTVIFTGSKTIKSRQKEKQILSENLDPAEKRSIFQKLFRKRKRSE